MDLEAYRMNGMFVDIGEEVCQHTSSEQIYIQLENSHTSCAHLYYFRAHGGSLTGLSYFHRDLSRGANTACDRPMTSKGL